MGDTAIIREIRREAILRTSEGPQGPRGTDGTDGLGIELKGAYSSLADLRAAVPTGAVGDTYAVQGDLYTWGPDVFDWVNAGTFRGPPGAPGQIRFTGHGAPGTIIGAEPGDTYLDLDTGDLYKLT